MTHGAVLWLASEIQNNLTVGFPGCYGEARLKYDAATQTTAREIPSTETDDDLIKLQVKSRRYRLIEQSNQIQDQCKVMETTSRFRQQSSGRDYTLSDRFYAAKCCCVTDHSRARAGVAANRSRWLVQAWELHSVNTRRRMNIMARNYRRLYGHYRR